MTRTISEGQKPSPNGFNWHPPPKSVDHLHSQTRSRDEAVHSDHKEQLKVFRGVEIFIEPPRILWWGCLCILETAPASWRLLAENCHPQTTWQFAAVFIVTDFVAWSPLTVQRNINGPYRNPMLHKSIKVVMARQTSLQVTTLNWPFSFFWVSAVPRQYCVWQFNYVMDRWNWQYFVRQLNIWPESINTYQIHTNDI